MARDKETKRQEGQIPDENLIDRRDFLTGLKKWSKIVISGAILGSALFDSSRDAHAAVWVNRRPGGWVNHVGPWHNWNNRGGSWANNPSGGGWANRAGGGGWANTGGGSWANRRGPGGWINRK